MNEEKVYYRESRWTYLIMLIIILLSRWYGNINILTGIAIFTFVPAIIMNEMKPKKIQKDATKRIKEE